MNILNPPGSVSAQWLNQAAPPVNHLLRRMFRLANSSWAHDFLFHPNSAVDAGILTSPLHLQYKVAGQICLDWKQERPPGPYNHEPYMDDDLSLCADGGLYADWVIIPAFNLGQHGACYFMDKKNDQDAGDDVDDNGAVRSALYRSVQDDLTGEVLYVGEMRETDKIQCIYMRHVSCAMHERAMCFFEGSVFRAAVAAAGSSTPLSPLHLAKALTLCMHTRETRMCIVCGLPPFAACNCRVPLLQAAHPNDMRHYAFNARSHLGQYTGKEYLVYMRDGVELARRVQLTQHRTNCQTDRETAAALRVWAVQDRLGNIVSRVIASPKDRAVAMAVAEASLNVEEKTFDELVDDLAAVDAKISAMMCDHHVEAVYDLQRRATAVHLSKDSPKLMANSQQTNGVAFIHPDNIRRPEISSGGSCSSQSSTSCVQRRILTSPSPARRTSPTSYPLPIVEMPQEVSSTVSSLVAMPIISSRSRRAPVRLRRLLPRGNRTVEPVVAPRSRELEVRIRKREAARRSDQRRVARVQQLQKETEALQKRVDFLRRRERAVRAENEDLRARMLALTMDNESS